MALRSSDGQPFFVSLFGGGIRTEFRLTHGTFGMIDVGITMNPILYGAAVYTAVSIALISVARRVKV